MKRFLKGALHVHTSLSDAKISPQKVVRKYKAQGFDFIVFTDHKYNFNIPDFVNDDMGMILIGGVELDVGIKEEDDYKTMPNEDLRATLIMSRMRNEFDDLAWPHVNALGVYNTNMKFKVVDGDVPKTYENMIDVINQNKGIPMINHPNWWFCTSLRELLQVNRNYLMEIGACCECDYGGNHNKENIEQVWDILLTKGKKIFGTFTDDSHHFNDEYNNEDFDPDCGVGYVEVWAEKNEESILNAIKAGEFYSSNGIYLDEYTVSDKGISIKVKPEEGVKYAIMFKGKMGILLKTVYGTEAQYTFDGNEWEDYVRVKVVSNKLKGDDDTHWQVERRQYFEALYTQPILRKKGVK